VGSRGPCCCHEVGIFVGVLVRRPSVGHYRTVNPAFGASQTAL
jgi:hypothetical protein